MKLGLGITLNRGAFVGGLDPDAKAYIDAVVAAGATVSAAQKKAIDEFYITGKDEGWYSGMKRILLPIWGVTLPNETCMINKVAKATSFGGVVHTNSGYVVGDGVNDYMLDSDNLSVLCSSTSLLYGCLAYQAQSSSTSQLSMMGVNDAANSGRSEIRTNNQSGATQVFLYNTGSGTEILNSSDSSRIGIYTSSRTSATSHSGRVRRSNGVTSLGTSSTTSESPPSRPLMYLAANVNGAASRYSNGSFGAFFIGDGLSNDDTDKFTAALETLWETTTGLTLP
jgi:hypothetical protein